MKLSIAVVAAMLFASAAPLHAEPSQPVISRSIVKQMVDIRQAADKHDWETVIAECDAARQVPGISTYDAFVIDRFLGMAYFGLGDHDRAAGAFYAAVTSGAAPVDDVKQILNPTLALLSERQDNEKIIELNERLRDVVASDEEANSFVAIAYFNLRDKTYARKYARRSADLAAQAGKEPQAVVVQILNFTGGD